MYVYMSVCALLLPKKTPPSEEGDRAASKLVLSFSSLSLSLSLSLYRNTDIELLFFVCMGSDSK